MFTAWPFIGLITAGVMVTVLLVLKFGDKLCKARLTTLSDQTTVPHSSQVDDFELLEDGNGTMMDFNLQGDLGDGSQADYSPHDRPATSMTSASQMSTRREFAL
eukprot:GFUD01007152.1.p2 GENE.GFUD01007152.1~~GFUD01007152.1.p2  ORF type:complete len:104 (-),score=29.88 GFUD01007152.1:85-396(-)